MKPGTITLAKRLHAPISKVWQALTDKDHMKLWYFDIPEFRPEVGTEFQFWGGDENKKWLHLCKVTEMVPGKKLTHTWRYDGYPGESFVTFELTEEKGSTLLQFTHTGLDTFPKEVPELAQKNFEVGWNSIINEMLPEYLEKA